MLKLIYSQIQLYHVSMVTRVLYYHGFYGTTCLVAQHAIYDTTSSIVQRVLLYNEFYCTTSSIVQRVLLYNEFYCTTSSIVQRVLWYCVFSFYFNQFSSLFFLKFSYHTTMGGTPIFTFHRMTSNYHDYNACEKI
jgi:hypothetical protein